MPSELISVVEAVNTASATSKPVLAGKANARLLGPIELEIERSAATGGGTVYGANLPTFASGDAEYCRQLGSDGATGRTVFTTTIPYVAFSNYNLVVLQNGAVLQQGAGAGKWQVSDVGGFAVITLGTAAAVGDVIETSLTVPAVVYTHTAVQFKQVLAQGYELLWYVSDATTSPAITNVYATVVGE